MHLENLTKTEISISMEVKVLKGKFTKRVEEAKKDTNSKLSNEINKEGEKEGKMTSFALNRKEKKRREKEEAIMGEKNGIALN